MAESVFTPSDVFRMAGVSQEMQRDWRRRGLLDQVGKQIGGRWLYSLRDVLLIYIARRLSDHAAPLSASVGMAMACFDNVREFALAAFDRRQITATRFAACWYDPAKGGKDDLSSWQVEHFDNEPAMFRKSPIILKVDCAALAFQMPDAITEAIKEAIKKG